MNRDNSQEAEQDPFPAMSQLPLILPVNRTLAIIMGGGAGTRLFPLTKERAKPAVPLGGKYRLVDIPISNCLNSGIRSIYVLTQFNSMSLHRHINASYKFDNFTPSFVEILAAQQTPEGSHWYQGTADAVRQNLRYFFERPVDYYVILSGDQLYRMDYRHVLRQHLETNSDITVGTIPVNRVAASGFGIMHTDDKRKIIEFVEKPKDPQVLDGLRIPSDLLRSIGQPENSDLYQASMGIYVFRREVLQECLDNDFADFGKNIIPAAIRKYKVTAYIFQGYWEDIGTIAAFFEANLNLTDPNPKFSFNEPGAPVYTHPRFLPASIVRSARIDQSLICDGCVIDKATVEHSIIGIRSVIGEDSLVKDVILMGADYYEADLGRSDGGPQIGIGRGCDIRNAIIDKNARIGDNVVISPEGKDKEMNGEGFYIRDGIVVIPKNSVITSGTRI
ncbi:MAG TPA: glucose-1-phosphate adenylyltransferase [Terrimicrobiaceae bacterium]